MANGNGRQSETVSQAEINGILWKACDTFRGAIDPSEYKNYILVMLFVRYISDVWQDQYAKLIVHELCHLKEHNHSPGFYRILQSMMPDWEQRRKRLNGCVVG